MMDNTRQIDVRAIDLEVAGVSIAFVNTDSAARKDACRMNANRIAAADDLYEALQEIINTPWIGGKGGFVKARAALAKARGEQ
jgi:hypothetical protein